MLPIPLAFLPPDCPQTITDFQRERYKNRVKQTTRVVKYRHRREDV